LIQIVKARHAGLDPESSQSNIGAKRRWILACAGMTG
jgi:hypothetical protein